MPSYTVALFVGYDWKCGDAKAYVNIPDTSKIISAELRYTVDGYWRTGLYRVLVNGVVVKEYPPAYWPWEDHWKGSDQVDIAGYLVPGRNLIVFNMIYQIGVCGLIGSGQLDAVLYITTTEPMPEPETETPSEESEFNYSILIFAVIILLFLAILLR